VSAMHFSHAQAPGQDPLRVEQRCEILQLASRKLQGVLHGR
jgi:hypothetical protein